MPASSTARRGFTTVVALGLGLVLCSGLVGCDSDSDEDASNAAASASCNANIAGVAKQQPPSDLPLPSGAQQAYSSFTQGKTRYYSFALSGNPDALTKDRDNYDKQLVQAGYKITDTDQESGAEAESSFSGPHGGSTRWRNLCSSHVVLLLGVSS